MSYHRPSSFLDEQDYDFGIGSNSGFNFENSDFPDTNLLAIGGDSDTDFAPSNQQTRPTFRSWGPRAPWVPIHCDQNSLTTPSFRPIDAEYRSPAPSVTTASISREQELLYPMSPASLSSQDCDLQSPTAGTGLEEDMNCLIQDDKHDEDQPRKKKKKTSSETASDITGSSDSATSSITRSKRKGAALKPAEVSYICKHLVEKVVEEEERKVECGESFRIQSDLKKHQDKHKKPHKCRDCPKGFTTSSDLDRHAWTIHDRDSAKGAYWFTCPMEKCRDNIDKDTGRPKVWKRKDNYKQHVTRIHPENDADEIVKLAQHQKNYIDVPINPALAQSPVYMPHSVADGYDTTLLMNQYNTHCYGPQQSQHLTSYPMPTSIVSGSPTYTRTIATPVAPSSATSSYSSTSFGRQPTSASSVRSHPSSRTSLSIGEQHRREKTKTVIAGDQYTQRPQKRPVELIPTQTIAVQRSNRTPVRQLQEQRGRSRVAGQSTCAIEASSNPMAYEQLNSSIDYQQQRSPVAVETHRSSCSCGQTSSTITGGRQQIAKQDSPSTAQSNPNVMLHGPRIESTKRQRLNHVAGSSIQFAGEQNQDTHKASGKPFTCDYSDCVKSFTCRSNLQKHKVRHQRLYACTFDECQTNKRFGSKNDWKRHEASQHNGVPDQLWCSQCMRTFSEDNEFLTHMESEHNANIARVEARLAWYRIRWVRGGGFWCGFCRDIIRIEADSISPGDDRANHIANHFYPAKARIEDWVLPRGGRSKGEAANSMVCEADMPETKSEDEGEHKVVSSVDEESEEELGELHSLDADGDLEEDFEQVHIDDNYAGTSHQAGDDRCDMGRKEQTTHSPVFRDMDLDRRLRQSTVEMPDIEHSSPSSSASLPFDGATRAVTSRSRTPEAMFECCECSARYTLGLYSQCMGLGSISCHHEFCDRCYDMLDTGIEPEFE